MKIRKQPGGDEVFEKKLLREVGQRLLAEGNCPFDSSCSYAGVAKCNASGKTLEMMLAENRNKINQRLKEEYGGGFIMQASSDIYAELWPCNCLLSIIFVSEFDRA